MAESQAPSSFTIISTVGCLLVLLVLPAQYPRAAASFVPESSVIHPLSTGPAAAANRVQHKQDKSSLFAHRNPSTGIAPPSPLFLSTAARSTSRRTGWRRRLLPPPLLHASRPMDSDDDDDGDTGMMQEWDPVMTDPASTTAQLLAALWDMIVNASDLERGEERTTLFPNMQSQLSQKSYLDPLMGHLNVCKDVCDTFGVTTVLRPHQDGDLGKITGFTVKSYKSNKVDSESTTGSDVDDGGYNFAPDPFWDDEYDPLSADPMLGTYDDDDDEEDGAAKGTDSSAASLLASEVGNDVPADDEELVGTTKRWVSRLMSDMGVCPFTSGPDLAGLPMGNVFYTVDRSTSVEDVYARYWKEVARVEQTNERDLSTTLLILPEFALHNVEGFENFSQSLTQPMETLHVEDLIQLVFFHPEWSFRDGSDRMFDTANAANYARRSPWPMVNILRTKQVRAAQRGIPTGLVYQQNEKTLNAVGAKELERMLRLRDWDDLEGQKVNRRDHEALRVAQELQLTGVVEEKDQRFEYDATPAANKVDRSQIEGGDMVNVILQALQVRLYGEEGRLGEGRPLSGAETSAAMMASDFLVQELDRIASGEKPTISQEEGDVDPEMAAIFGGSTMSDMGQGGGGY